MFRCMQRTNIYLEESQTQALDTLARSEGVARAEIIRRLLDRALAGEADTQVAAMAAIEASFGCVTDDELALPDRGKDPRDEYLRQRWADS